MSTTVFTTVNDRVTVVLLPTDVELPTSDEQQRYRDARLFLLEEGEYWLFDYGVVVFWGGDQAKRQQLLIELTKGSAEVIAQQDQLNFTLGQQLKLNRDLIELPGNDPLIRLAISHALAQSILLAEYESHTQQAITRHMHLPEQLAKDGKIPLSSEKLAKIRGQLFKTKSDVILHYELLDTPQFFWEYPEYETAYHLTEKYLDLSSRLDILNKKLETIDELFNMLADEQKHHHSAFLEWIIIILIAVEIVFYLAEKLPNWF